ncbi:aldo/keto reductase [Rhodospirillum sp. A1_3_36]|uniref:aldo/keto reductase n=1 Tax=Rhodospirillum sp. A1_3_36 TaxID=3391666 RepID=UPI0039A4BE6A
MHSTPQADGGIRLRRLGRTPLMVSEIGFGCWGIGGRTPGQTSYGATDDSQSLRTLERARERGITFFDTAPVYGAGHSEELVGQAFAGSKRDGLVITTKGGCKTYEDPLDFSIPSLERGLEESLRRLKTDHVDLFLLHNPPPERMLEGDDLRALADRWKAEGKIRAFGSSVARPADGEAALKGLAPDALLVNFNLVDQRCDGLGLLDAAWEAGCSLIARTPLCFGFLAGSLDTSSLFPEGDHRAKWSEEIKAKWIAEGRAMVDAARIDAGGTQAQIALRFCLWHKAMCSAIPGMLSPSEVDENADAASVLPPLSSAAVERMRGLYQDESFSIPTKPRRGLRK